MTPAEVDSARGAGDLGNADRCKRERPATLAPKEQPPRKLSGKRTARRQHSGKQPPRSPGRLTEGVDPIRRVKSLRSRDRGGEGREKAVRLIVTDATMSEAAANENHVQPEAPLRATPLNAFHRELGARAGAIRGL